MLEVKELKITIVGAGACGLVCLHQLVEKLSRQGRSNKTIRIFLFDKSGLFGMGVAYGTPIDAHLLNLRAQYMSAVWDQPRHFIQWLEANPTSYKDKPDQIAIDQNLYPPRWLYAKYLTHLFHETVAKAKSSHIKIEFIRAMVTDVRVDSHDIDLILSDNQIIKSDYLILTLGNFPSTIFQELKGRKGYFPYPWPVQNLMEKISPDRPVCVLGAGLSAVDTIFTLMENGHREKIYFLSRTGLLPKVQGPDEDYTPRFFTMEAIEALSSNDDRSVRLSKVGHLYQKELETAYALPISWMEIFNPQGSPASILAEDIQRAVEGPLAYQSVLNAVADLFGPVWNRLSIADRKKFDREYKTFWHVYQYAMPLINAHKIQAAIQTGQLEVMAGLKTVRLADDRGVFQLGIQTRFGPNKFIEAPYLVNATGQGKDVTRIDDQLIQNLLKRGLLVPHPNGGIEVDFETSAILHADSRSLKRLFAVGELTRGVHFLTNSLGENITCAHRMTDFLIHQAAVKGIGDST